MILLICLLSCGKKGLPTTPRAIAPKPIQDLNYYFDNGDLVLKWSIPHENTDGSRLENLQGFVLYKAIIPFSKRNCPTCPTPFRKVADIDLGYPKNARVKEGIVEYVDKDLSYQHQYTYKVFSYNRYGDLSNSSNLVTLNWDIPPSPPTILGVESGDRVVNIIWEPCLDDFGKHSIAGYRIYRRLQDHSYPYNPLNSILIQNTTFEDRHVENGVSYFYVVRSVKDVDGSLIESINSEEIEAIPIDLKPPAPPKDLVAIPFDWGIELRWERNKEPDVLGYYIYRRAEGEIFSKRINDQIVTEVRYRDKRVSPNNKYHYSVTALDNSPQRNESRPSEEVVLDYY
ncbi:MAG TPA: hypothetical protein EYP21_09330 [Syntrophaceae bacterium]|nr:hypothetical protein [Syntrophaceae bacterium]